MSQRPTLQNGSRRAFLQWSAAAVDRDLQHFPPGSVVINANENPLGPCDLARKALSEIIPEGGRYCWWLKDELAKSLADSVGVKPENVAMFPGSSEPLHFSVMAFTSPSRSY